jgi:hypothetical protein
LTISFAARWVAISVMMRFASSAVAARWTTAPTASASCVKRSTSSGRFSIAPALMS